MLERIKSYRSEKKFFKGLSDRYKRPRAYDNDVYQWHLGRIPQKNSTGSPNPAYTNAIFVVHGMGNQLWAQTAAQLRYGFEDVLEEILLRTQENPLPAEEVPPPFIQEGYWANYDNLEESFPDDWKKLEKGKRTFFSILWKSRIFSLPLTVGWVELQLLRLIFNRRMFKDIKFHVWIIYCCLQFIVPVLLLLTAIRFPKVLTQVIGDLRIYFSPKGIVERAIVQRIDERVGRAYLKMIGIDWDFMPLPATEKIKRNGRPIVFKRVIWVAHSLGSVVSYNVLSDLLQRADQLSKTGTPQQKEGVTKFYDSLHRFVTIGSPLDKIAVLFGTNVIRPWQVLFPRSASNWWVNFYHVLDPVSGPLSNPLICKIQEPLNYHIGFWAIPGRAHIKYWKDKITLRYLLSRLYGKAVLNVPPLKLRSPLTLRMFAVTGYLVWLGLPIGFLWVILHLRVTGEFLIKLFEIVTSIPVIRTMFNRMFG